jgi:large subunit ribosomal protein L14
MILVGTKMKVADNTGARIAECIRIKGGYRKRYGHIGDVVVAAVKEAIPHAPIKKSDIVKAVIVRTKKEIRRADGTYLRFDENACVIIDIKAEPKGTRIFGPVAREIRKRGYAKIASWLRRCYK